MSDLEEEIHHFQYNGKKIDWYILKCLLFVVEDNMGEKLEF